MPKQVVFHETGDAHVLKIEDQPVCEPGAGEVRINVAAIGLNRAEIMFRRGQYLEQPQFPSRLGYEASGVVDALGPGVEGLNVGDRVSTIPAFSMVQYGVCGESAIVPAHAVAAYPENLSPAEGTSIWMQYMTAYGALVNYGKLKQGDVVLITAASSSVGLAAIQMVKAANATAIASTRGAGKKQALLDAGADHVIVTDEENLVERVMAITASNGATILFDPVAGPMLTTLAQATARGGTIFVYGALAPAPTPYSGFLYFPPPRSSCALPFSLEWPHGQRIDPLLWPLAGSGARRGGSPGPAGYRRSPACAEQLREQSLPGRARWEPPVIVKFYRPGR
jgi:NADPH2:quinone reductase